MATVELTSKEARTIDKAICLLRDKHYRAYYDSKNPDGDTAQGHKATAHELDLFRSRILREAN
jgi:hypothetical protein